MAGEGGGPFIGPKYFQIRVKNKKGFASQVFKSPEGLFQKEEMLFFRDLGEGLPLKKISPFAHFKLPFLSKIAWSDRKNEERKYRTVILLGISGLSTQLEMTSMGQPVSVCHQ